MHHEVSPASSIASDPCATCDQAARCAAELPACDQFVNFTNGATAKR
jgi:hypothetical protein